MCTARGTLVLTHSQVVVSSHLPGEGGFFSASGRSPYKRLKGYDPKFCAFVYLGWLIAGIICHQQLLVVDWTCLGQNIVVYCAPCDYALWIVPTLLHHSFHIIHYTKFFIAHVSHLWGVSSDGATPLRTGILWHVDMLVGKFWGWLLWTHSYFLRCLWGCLDAICGG